ncbi:hypothetical protein ACQKL5_01775 [Peribacillus sp. NPDC097675]|uniref:hypothetical protein n=1 Tax=Peribacillus sp. NPDC097675 TaxID=3390618 RepID=UPI003D027494
MKRILLFISFCFILFIIYFDLTTGTLPTSQLTSTPVQPSLPVDKPENPSIAYKEILIKPGDTLLSIIEKEKEATNKPIEEIISDFQSLNEGLQPENMQIGKTYKIPIYK